MKKLVLLLVLVALGWNVYGRYLHQAGDVEAMPDHAPDAEAEAEAEDAPALHAIRSGPSAFTCDGRTYYSQMTSCDEAKYFLEHCPGVKMDKNHDGTPCEKQWCS